MPDPSQQARRLQWQVVNLPERLPGVLHALVVSVDGLPLAVSEGLDRATLDQLSAVTSGMVSLSQGAARHLGRRVRQTMVEMDDGSLLVMIVGRQGALAVLTTPECNLEQLAWEMHHLLVETNRVVSPALREELRASLPR